MVGVAREKAYVVPSRAQLGGTNNQSAAVAAPGSGALPPESAGAQQILQRFAQLDPNQGRISPEQAGEIKQHFKELVGQGAAAVPAIRQFLEKNQDFSFEEASGANQVGYSSVRAGLFAALHEIGGAEATDLMLSTLRGTGDPAEIGLLARYLEEQAPGQYRQEVVVAARETLDQASRAPTQGREVGPLFQVLQNYGDANVVADLEKAMPQWHYYATMALAGLPEGQGVPALVQTMQESSRGGKTPPAFTLQMLAQMAPQSPEAAAALVEQARQTKIPDRVWTKIVEGLAGDQYQLGKPPTDSANPALPPAGLKTYHIASGNQNFYSLPFNIYGTPEQAAQRQAVLEQLAAATQDPAALQALQNARAVLAGPMAPAR
jgi:hypothetical protein